MTKKHPEVPPAETALRHSMASEIHYAMSLRRVSIGTLARETGIKEIRLMDLLSGRSRERLDFTLTEVSKIGEFLGHSVHIEFVAADEWALPRLPSIQLGSSFPCLRK